ncbi:MAG TPA: hypothetical protein VE861_03900, partial [Gemmatimonadaceae bacterium]|nr:hypothetical protein [Gemmatimonadaceae bacterium]
MILEPEGALRVRQRRAGARGTADRHHERDAAHGSACAHDDGHHAQPSAAGAGAKISWICGAMPCASRL